MLTIGDRIKYFRKRRGYTQSQLAEMAEVHPVSIRKYETNKMRPQQEQIEKIAKALGLSSGALTGSEERLHIETVGDLTGMLITLHKSGILRLEGERDEKGEIIEETAHFVPALAIQKYFTLFNSKQKKEEIDTECLEIKFTNSEILHDVIRWEAAYFKHISNKKFFEENGITDQQIQEMFQISQQLELIEMHMRSSTKPIIHKK